MTNSENYSIPTICSSDLHLLQTNLAVYQKEFIIQLLKSLVILFHILKLLLAILNGLKEF
jgi:hypothetical protein